MGRTAAPKIAVLAGLALVATLTGCGSAPDLDGSSPESSGPAQPVPGRYPSVSSPPAPVDWPVGGWDIHYREDGRIKVLKVEDFPP